MAKTPDHLTAVPIGGNEREAIKKCMILVDAAPLQAYSDSKVDLKELKSVIETFVNEFALWDKVPKSEVKVVAIRVTKPFLLEVPNTVLLIPTAITSGNPSIENEVLDIKSCLFLTKDVELKPGFNCLAFLLSPHRV